MLEVPRGNIKSDSFNMPNVVKQQGFIIRNKEEQSNTSFTVMFLLICLYAGDWVFDGNKFEKVLLDCNDQQGLSSCITMQFNKTFCRILSCIVRDWLSLFF